MSLTREGAKARGHEGTEGVAQGVVPIRVRYSECDPMGVAHHTAYPVWFEMGRTELLRSTGVSYRDLEDQGVLLAVVSLEVKYKAPARYDDVIALETTLESVTHVRIVHSYRLLRDHTLLATAQTTLACLDLNGRLRPVPETIR